jgi:hypothetical protein
VHCQAADKQTTYQEKYQGLLHAMGTNEFRTTSRMAMDWCTHMNETKLPAQRLCAIAYNGTEA